MSLCNTRKNRNQTKSSFKPALALILLLLIGLNTGCDMVVKDLLKGAISEQEADFVAANGSAGGYIFYDDEADGVDDIPGYRFLEAAPCGWYNGGDDPVFEWGGFGTPVGTTHSKIGLGEDHTAVIIAELGDGSYAAKVCADYSLIFHGIEYDDWFLPSWVTLNLMYENLHRKSSGGFLSETYWSSTENTSTSQGHAFSQDFSNGFIWSGNSKTYQNRVRPVRAF